MTSTPTEPKTSGPNHGRAPSDEIDLGQLVGVLIDRWALIVGTTALFGLGGIFYSFSAVPVFQADALVQVEEEKQGLDVAAMLGGELGTGSSTTKAEIEIIQSRMVLGEAVQRTRSDITVTADRMPLLGLSLIHI